MTTLQPKQLADARNIANDARELSDVAPTFKAALVAYAAEEPAHRGLSVSIVDSRTQGALNFRIVTAHGEVEAMFDHAFQFGRLVGRYRFFSLSETPLAEIESREIWSMLFDQNYAATWDPNEDFRWHFTPGHRDVPGDVGRLVNSLLLQIQAGLSTY